MLLSEKIEQIIRRNVDIDIKYNELDLKGERMAADEIMDLLSEVTGIKDYDLEVNEEEEIDFN